MRRRIRALIAAILWAAILGRGDTPSGHAQTLEVPIWSGCIVHLDTGSRHCDAWAMVAHAGQHVYSTWHGTRWITRTTRVDVQSYPIFQAPAPKPQVYTSVYADTCFGVAPKVSALTGIPAAVLRGVIRVESGGSATVASADGLGSIGCTQPLSSTFAAFAAPGCTSITDPLCNVWFAGRYLDYLMSFYHCDLRGALGHFNGGNWANDAYAARVLSVSW